VVTGTFGLAFLAGILSTLSPCVLPLLPIVLGTAVSQHKLGPAALAAGLALSFVTIGMFVATAALLPIVIGLVLVMPVLQARVALAAGPVSNWAEQRFGGMSGSGLSGQFGVGLLLGAVWAPCVGPTLGAASVLAAQGKDLAQVSLTMLIFGLGAALPLLILGMLSREALLRWRNKMMAAGQGAKMLMGAVLILTGLVIVTGADKMVEASLVNIMPEWLTSLTTRF
jgi:cytochrome c-type biogenesis protein